MGRKEPGVESGLSHQAHRLRLDFAVDSTDKQARKHDRNHDPCWLSWEIVENIIVGKDILVWVGGIYSPFDWMSV